MKVETVTLVIILCSFGVCNGFLGWLFDPSGISEKYEESDHAEAGREDRSSPASSAGVIQRVPFEMKSADDKFLSTGRELMMAGLTELDSCHHTIIAELKTSCSDITEEELAKLGVALLNCQSKAEGRPTYTCTEDMTVAECTKPMDPNTWNSYHIISNRARSVCYSVRQQQFQRQTQIAVNHLASSTEEQVHFMQYMQESQAELNNLASDTLQGMAEGQKTMAEKQDKLKDSQVELQSQISNNLETLTKEKSLIAAGHKELASMTDDIKKQLENATSEILTQDKQRKNNHEKVVQDLASMQQKAKEAWQKLDQQVEFMAQYQHETSEHYKDTLTNLQKMNDTITYLLQVVHDMQSEVDQRLGWIATFMNGAGENLAVISTCVVHGCYFVLAAMSATFLQTPIMTRLVLLLLVPLNAIAEIRHGVSLEMAPLTLILIGVALVNWLAIIISTKLHSQQERADHVCAQSPTSPVRLDAIDFKMGTSIPQIPSLIHEDSRLHELTGDGDYHPSVSEVMTSDEEDDDVDLTAFMANNSMSADSTVDYSSEQLKTSVVGSSKGSLKDDSHNSTNILATPQLSSTVISTPSTCGISFGETSIDPEKAKRHLGTVLETVKMRGTPSPAGSRSSSPSRSRSSTPKKPVSRINKTISQCGQSPNKRSCSGTTKTGIQCKQSCTPGKDFCWRHNKSSL
ncbi:protein brambleberry-like [Amphiura filiformis]|uniref:protein brambleberry-like n=1 Tax=Amphiura filiformis TaxID=82378 RepID=UPI003B2240F8